MAQRRNFEAPSDDRKWFSETHLVTIAACRSAPHYKYETVHCLRFIDNIIFIWERMLAEFSTIL